MQPKATVVLDGYGVPESLRWYDDALWFCDLAHGTVHRWDTRGEPETVAEVPGRAGGLGWLPDGRMLVVSMDGHCVYRREPDGDLKDIAGGPANDMFVDRRGRLGDRRRHREEAGRSRPPRHRRTRTAGRRCVPPGSCAS